MKVWIAHENGLKTMGAIPPGFEIGILSRGDAALPGDPAAVEFWAPPFLGQGDVVGLAAAMPNLKVVQLLSAGADAWIGQLADGVTLCDARGVHDSSTAEWTVGAILGSLRRFDFFAQAQAAGRWTYAEAAPTDELAGKSVLIVGAGSIGAAIASRLEPFEVELTYVARTARDGVHGIDELPHLLPHADVVVMIVPLTPETRGLADAGFFASLKDGALFVNAARGPVADTAAMTKELATGRIFAALDVTDPEPLPTGHPLWTMSNVLLTPHVAGSVRGFIPRSYRLVGDQLRRFAQGESLLNVVRDGY